VDWDFDCKPEKKNMMPVKSKRAWGRIKGKKETGKVIGSGRVK